MGAEKEHEMGAENKVAKGLRRGPGRLRRGLRRALRERLSWRRSWNTRCGNGFTPVQDAHAPTHQIWYLN